MIDYYEILRLPPGASAETIEEQYQFLLQGLGPRELNGGGGDEQSARARKEIRFLKEAYEVLHDSRHRREYDQQRNVAIEAARQSSSARPADVAPLQLISRPNEPSPTPARSAKTNSPQWRDSLNAGVIAAFMAGVLIASGVLSFKYWHTGSQVNKSFVASFLSAAQHRETARELASKQPSDDPSMIRRPTPDRQVRSLSNRVADKAAARIKSQSRLQESDAADGQIGAVRRERPVSVDIILARNQQTFGAQQVGNVEVYYPDGNQDCWTTKGNCGQAHVAANGTVGWTVYQATVSGNYDFQPNGILVLRRGGQIIQRINVVASGHIDGWNFLDAGGKVVVRARGSSGATVIARYESATGRLLESVDASRADLPSWASPVADQ